MKATCLIFLWQNRGKPCSHLPHSFVSGTFDDFDIVREQYHRNVFKWFLNVDKTVQQRLSVNKVEGLLHIVQNLQSASIL